MRYRVDSARRMLSHTISRVSLVTTEVGDPSVVFPDFRLIVSVLKVVNSSENSGLLAFAKMVGRRLTSAIDVTTGAVY